MSEKPIILYIEDNPDNRKLVSRVLNADGFMVLEAANAPEGFIILQNQKPDIILMDIHLPGIDGHTMTEQLRQREQLNTVPIIALTANVTNDDEQKSRYAGCNGFIQKPINVDELPNQVRAYLTI
ncbi:MAG: response regulator [Anaerolineae bacterium]|nr:response regulator [Anaerolineae bacterium]